MGDSQSVLASLPKKKELRWLLSRRSSFLFEIYQGLVIDLTEVSTIHGGEIHVEGFFTRVERTGEVDRVNRKILEVCR